MHIYSLDFVWESQINPLPIIDQYFIPRDIPWTTPYKSLWNKTSKTKWKLINNDKLNIFFNHDGDPNIRMTLP